MIVNKARLIEVLGHEDSRVRDASARALDSFFAGSTGISSHLIKAIVRFPDDCLTQASALKYFIPEEQDIHEIVRLFNSIDKKDKDDKSLSLRFHLTQCLLQAPFNLLDKNRDILSFSKELLQLYEIAKNRESFRNQDLEILWEELFGLCDHLMDNHIEPEDRAYGGVLIDGLCRHRDTIRDKVIICLRQEEPSNYNFQEYMVKLAGQLRLNETVPYIFRILHESDYMHTVHSECIRTLGKIGSREVVAKIEKIYDKDPERKIEFAEILKYIPHDYAENLALKLIQQEQDLNAKTFLACSLCDMFSWKAVEILKDMVRKQQVDHDVTTITDDLVPVYAYHDKPIEQLQVLSITEKKQGDAYWKKNPLHQAAEPMREAFLKYREQEKAEIEKKEKERKVKKLDNIISIKKMRRKIKKRMGKKRK